MVRKPGLLDSGAAAVLRRFLFAVVVIAVVGCSNTLDRGMAGEKIKTSSQFGEAPELWVNVGRIGLSCEPLPPANDTELTVARMAGYVTVKPDGKNFWQVSLTDRGKALPEAKKLESDTPDTKGGCSLQLLSIPLATREFVDVTGITNSSDNQAQVDFLFKWKPTELGTALTEKGDIYTKLTGDQQFSLNTIIRGRSAMFWNAAPLRLPITDMDVSFGDTGRARFEKYDDGWRLMAP